MTNEELALRAKQHEEWATLELWEAVRRFVRQQAIRYLDRAGNAARIELDDLMQAGFLAMLDAVRLYDPEREAGFLTVIGWTIKSRFAEAGGHRSSKRDPLLYSDSLDISPYKDDPDGESVADSIADPRGEYAFLFVDYAEYVSYCRKLLFSAMERLTPWQYTCVAKHFFGGMALDEIAKESKFGSSRQNVSLTIKIALMTMKRGKYRKELFEALHGFDDFRELSEERGRVELKAFASNQTL